MRARRGELIVCTFAMQARRFRCMCGVRFRFTLPKSVLERKPCARAAGGSPSAPLPCRRAGLYLWFMCSQARSLKHVAGS